MATGKTIHKGKTLSQEEVRESLDMVDSFGITTLGGISEAVWRKLGLEKISGHMSTCLIGVMHSP